jgi:hypothetical protein
MAETAGGLLLKGCKELCLLMCLNQVKIGTWFDDSAWFGGA